MESLAEPGGICISGKVFEEVETKLPLTYEYQGEQTVKNIAKPVRVFRVVLKTPSPSGALINQGSTEGQGEGALGMSTAVTTPHPDLPPPGGKEPKKLARGLKTWGIVAGLMLIVGGIVTIRYLARPSLSPQSSVPKPYQRPCPCPTSPPLSSCPSST